MFFFFALNVGKKAKNQQLSVQSSCPISGTAAFLQGVAELVGGHVGRRRRLLVFSNELNVK